LGFGFWGLGFRVEGLGSGVGDLELRGWDPGNMKTSTEVVSSFRNISMISKYHFDTWCAV
jgi:hypothetical protein